MFFIVMYSVRYFIFSIKTINMIKISCVFFIQTWDLTSSK